jgi:hypothetical protein
MLHCPSPLDSIDKIVYYVHRQYTTFQPELFMAILEWTLKPRRVQYFIQGNRNQGRPPGAMQEGRYRRYCVYHLAK